LKDGVDEALKAAADQQIVLTFESRQIATNQRSRLYVYLDLIHQRGRLCVRQKEAQLLLMKKPGPVAVNMEKTTAPKVDKSPKGEVQSLIGPDEQALIQMYGLNTHHHTILGVTYWTVLNDTPYNDYKYSTTLMQAIQCWLERTSTEAAHVTQPGKWDSQEIQQKQRQADEALVKLGYGSAPLSGDQSKGK
jgi:hypothetical protein